MRGDCEPQARGRQFTVFPRAKWFLPICSVLQFHSTALSLRAARVSAQRSGNFLICQVVRKMPLIRCFRPRRVSSAFVLIAPDIERPDRDEPWARNEHYNKSIGGIRQAR